MSNPAVDAAEAVLRARVITARGGSTQQLAWDVLAAAEHATGSQHRVRTELFRQTQDLTARLDRCEQENGALRASWVDAVDEQVSRAGTIVTDLADAVDAYLAAEFPRGTDHPADKAGARLRAAADAARTRLAEEQT